MKILSIETSCDETSIAVLQAEKDGIFMHPKSANSSECAHANYKILSNIVSSQVAIHAPFGGVVPMLAKREHQKNLVPILKKSLTEARLLQIQNAKCKSQNYNAKFKILKELLNREETLFKKLTPFLEKYQKPNIDLIAVTNGPGLEPALWVGVNFAKALAYFWGLPVMPVNHVESHIMANWLLNPVIPAKAGIQKIWMPDRVRHDKKTLFPAVSLVVSGGHTQLILMRDFGQYEILGETRDDAAGEAFDKLAKMLNLGYPGGPIISQIAERHRHPERSEGSPTNVGNEVPHTREILRSAQNDKKSVVFPRPMLNSLDYDFSFSGLKTAALYFVKTLDKKTLKKLTPAICAEFQQAAIDVLVSKTIRAARQYNAKTILLGGGVAANQELRNQFIHKLKAISHKLNFLAPPKNFCTDNAAMIALTAYLKTKKQKLQTKNWKQITVNGNLRLA